MKGILIAAILLFSAQTVCGQTMNSVFAAMPDEVLPMLEKNPRLDLIDLYNYNIQAKAENVFGGTSVLQTKTESLLRIRLTDASRWELKRLPQNEDEIYACVHSLTASATDSKIIFYSKDWKQIELDNFEIPGFQDFWIPADSLSPARRSELWLSLQPAHIEATWAEEAPELTFKVSVNHLSPDDRKDASLCLRPVTYIWREGLFVRR